MEREYNVAEYNKKAFQLMKLILSNILREKNKTNKRNLTNHTFLLIDNLKKKKKVWQNTTTTLLPVLVASLQNCENETNPQLCYSLWIVLLCI